jgi:hypothetical protein
MLQPMICDGLQVLPLQSHPTMFHLITHFPLRMGLLAFKLSLELCTDCKFFGDCNGLPKTPSLGASILPELAQFCYSFHFLNECTLNQIVFEATLCVSSYSIAIPIVFNIVALPEHNSVNL